MQEAAFRLVRVHVALADLTPRGLQASPLIGMRVHRTAACEGVRVTRQGADGGGRAATGTSDAIVSTDGPWEPELVLDHGWSPDAIDFERGEFDALGLGDDGRALLVMEAKARVSGPDGLEKLLTTWLRMARDPTIDLDNNAGRKYRELRSGDSTSGGGRRRTLPAVSGAPVRRVTATVSGPSALTAAAWAVTHL